MAIIQAQENNGLRIGSAQNLYQESLIQENYIQDMIKSFGLDIRYYKLKTPYPDVFKTILDTNQLNIQAYGEEFAQSWEDPVNMIAYVKWEQDGIVLNAYGIQPDSSLTMWLNQTDFAIAMAKKLSQWKSYQVVGNTEFILDFNDENDLITSIDNHDIIIDFHTDLFSGKLQAIVSDNDLDQILFHDSCSLHKEDVKNLKDHPLCIPTKILQHGDLKIDTGRINPLLYKSNHYDPFEDKLVDSHLHLEIFSILRDKHGCIRIMGGIRGEVIYHDTTVVGKYLDKIGPEVGDLIDIPVPGQNGNEVYKQKYEIVHIEETKTNESYANPFLRKYIYEISLRAYVSSGQEEPNGPSKEQVELKDKLELINDSAENATKKISVYENFEDDVYGGQQKINKRGNPSVQRDKNNSTINDFNPPKKKSGLKKTTTPLFIFKDMKMVLSLVDDPKNNISSLKLSPLKKSTKLDSNLNYLDYLRADDDTLVLVNGIQAYLLMSRFKQMELDYGTYCIKPLKATPIRLKHEVYAQHNGWADQPFHLVDNDDEIELNMDLQDLIGDNTTPKFNPTSQNRITFPGTNTYLEVEYEKPNDNMEIWTCYVILNSDKDKTHWPVCSFIKEKKSK